MRPPKDKEQVICPTSGEKLKPESCWDSIDPHDKKVTYGMIPRSHKHSKGFYVTIKEDCEWAGLPAPRPVEII